MMMRRKLVFDAVAAGVSLDLGPGIGFGVANLGGSPVWVRSAVFGQSGESVRR